MSVLPSMCVTDFKNSRAGLREDSIMEPDEQASCRDTVAFYDAIADTYDAEVLNYPDVTESYVSSITALIPEGKRCLELACGTGNWTRFLAERFEDVVAVDSSPAMLRIARAKNNARRINFVQNDLLNLPPLGSFAFIFGAFWITHVPRSRFENFWCWMRGCLTICGTIVLIDAWRRGPGGGGQKRCDPNGRTFSIVKEDWKERDLLSAVRSLRWNADLRAISPHVFALCAAPRANAIS